MNYAFHPIILAAIASTLFALVSFVFAFRIRKVLASSLLGILGLLMLIPGALVSYELYPELVDPRFARFHEFYDAIEVGMNHEQVNETLARIYPPSGSRQRPLPYNESEHFIGFSMNEDEWSLVGHDSVSMHFEDGSVVRKSYIVD